MKHNHWPIFIFLLLFIFGCRDKCERLDCLKGGCIEGKCVCDAGYEGGLCETAFNEKFVGTYTLVESCTAGDDTYEVSVFRNPNNPSEITIFGLWEQEDAPFTAVIWEDGTTFASPAQVLNDKRVVLQATSDVSGNNIELTYEVYNPGVSSPFDICQATLEKR